MSLLPVPPRYLYTIVFVICIFALLGSIRSLPASAGSFTQISPPDVPAHSFPVSGQSSSAKSQFDIRCGDFPNADDVQIIVKTGANEIYEKFPTQLLTELRCYDNILVFSDLEQDIGPYHVYDALANVTESVKQSSSDFDYYRTLQEYKETGQDIATLRPTTGSGAGWNLDKFKFLHMLEKTWTMRPGYKWYVFIEADTYLVRSNLLLWLQRFDVSKPIYLGSPTSLNGENFAHGGSGVILSGVALAAFAENKPGIAAKYDEEVKNNVYGDYMLMKALKIAGVELTPVWPMLQAEKPNTIPFGSGPGSGTRHWCQPSVTMHHITSNEANSLWNFEQRRPDMMVSGFPTFISFHMIPCFRLTNLRNLSSYARFTRSS